MICPNCNDEWDTLMANACPEEHVKELLESLVDSLPDRGPPNEPELVCKLCLRPFTIVGSTVAKRVNTSPPTYSNKKTPSQVKSPGVAIKRNVMFSGSCSQLNENVSVNRNDKEASGSSRGLNESASENRNAEEANSSDNGLKENVSENLKSEKPSGSMKRPIDEEMVYFAIKIAQKFGGAPVSIDVIVKRNAPAYSKGTIQLSVKNCDFTINANNESKMGEKPH